MFGALWSRRVVRAPLVILVVSRPSGIVLCSCVRAWSVLFLWLRAQSWSRNLIVAPSHVHAQVLHLRSLDASSVGGAMRVSVWASGHSLPRVLKANEHCGVVPGLLFMGPALLCARCSCSLLSGLGLRIRFGADHWLPCAMATWAWCNSASSCSPSGRAGNLWMPIVYRREVLLLPLLGGTYSPVLLIAGMFRPSAFASCSTCGAASAHSMLRLSCALDVGGLGTTAFGIVAQGFVPFRRGWCPLSANPPRYGRGKHRT